MDEKLKSCPFCGGEAKTCGPYGLWKRWCISHSCAYFRRSASLEFTEFNSEAEAITAWNTRSPSDRNDVIEECALPTMFAAFRTTVSDRGRYEMVFRFQTMEAMHLADDEWHQFRKAVS